MHLLAMYMVGFFAGIGAVIFAFTNDQSLIICVLSYPLGGALGILAIGCLFALFLPGQGRAICVEEFENMEDQTKHDRPQLR